MVKLKVVIDVLGMLKYKSGISFVQVVVHQGVLVTYCPNHDFSLRLSVKRQAFGKNYAVRFSRIHVYAPSE